MVTLRRENAILNFIYQTTMLYVMKYVGSKYLIFEKQK